MRCGAELLQRWALLPFLLTLSLMTIQQLSGQNNILLFTSDIFATAGSHLAPLVSSFICNSVRVSFWFGYFVKSIFTPKRTRQDSKAPTRTGKR